MLATGVTPRRWSVPGADHPKVAYYDEALSGARPVGQTVAIVGAGGIGFDMASWLLADRDRAGTTDIDDFMETWGVGTLGDSARRQLAAEPEAAARQKRRIAIFQRRNERMGLTLGKTTGWVLKALLRRGGVGLFAGVIYRKVDDTGLHYGIGAGTR